MKTQVKAHAKTNLWLKVIDRREDGFHNLETRMVALSLADTLTIDWNKSRKIELTCSDPALPTGEKNLVVRAVRAMEAATKQSFGMRIHLEKYIPSGAGLGGGSSDAAAVIKAIDQWGAFDLGEDRLAEVAATIGSDVPFFIYQRPCEVSGRGEIVEPLVDAPLPRLPIVLLKPNFGITAAWAYQNLTGSKMHAPDEVPQVCPWGTMQNDLERPAFMKYPLLATMKGWLLSQPEIHASLLSGSGSTLVGVLRQFGAGAAVAERAKNHFGDTTWTYSGTTLNH